MARDQVDMTPIETRDELVAWFEAGVEQKAQFRNGTLKPQGALRPPPPGESGWKDTAVVLPSEMLTIMARFEGFTGKFVFHCHMLEHEDNDMMRPYIVVS